MEYIVNYSTPNEANEAEKFLSDYEQFISTVNGSDIIVKVQDQTTYEQSKENLAFIFSKYKNKFIGIDPILKINHAKMDFSHIWPSGLFSDVTLRVSDGISIRDFNVHKSILASISDYFYALFTRFTESNNQIILINQTNPNKFNELMDLIYGEEFIFKDSGTLELLIMSNFFQIKGIDIDKYLLDASPLQSKIFLNI